MPTELPANFKEKAIDDSPCHLDNSSGSSWASGYNTCLERTNAAELLEALEYTQMLHLDKYEEGTVGHRVYMKIQNAIKKATDGQQ